MGRVGDDHPAPPLGLAVGLVVGPHQQEARELAGRSGRGLQGGRRHPGDRAEHLFELDQHLEPSLGARSRGAGMDMGEARQGRAGVGGLRVVLHRARAERVGAEIDGVLAMGETGEVSHEVALGDFWQRH